MRRLLLSLLMCSSLLAQEVREVKTLAELKTAAVDSASKTLDIRCAANIDVNSEVLFASGPEVTFSSIGDFTYYSSIKPSSDLTKRTKLFHFNGKRPLVTVSARFADIDSGLHVLWFSSDGAGTPFISKIIIHSKFQNIGNQHCEYTTPPTDAGQAWYTCCIFGAGGEWEITDSEFMACELGSVYAHVLYLGNKTGTVPMKIQRNKFILCNSILQATTANNLTFTDNRIELAKAWSERSRIYMPTFILYGVATNGRIADNIISGDVDNWCYYVGSTPGTASYIDHNDFIGVRWYNLNAICNPAVDKAGWQKKGYDLKSRWLEN